MIIQDIANKLDITEPLNGSWLSSIVNSLGGDLENDLWKNWANTLSITETINGTWIEAIARHYGATERVNGTWIEAINYNISSIVISLDPDAETFLTAADITDTTQINAINQLVVDMKNAGIWTKMLAVYPMVGGTATTHKWNLKNPLDTNAAFRLTFSGGWIHSSTGALPNGTNAFANTFLNANTVLQQFSHHHSFYHNTDNIGTALRSWGGVQGSGGSSQFRTTIEASGTTISFRDLGTINSETSLTATTLKGFRASSRTANNNTFIVKANGTATTSTTFTTPNALPLLNCFLAAEANLSAPGRYAAMQVAFHSIGDGLTTAEGLSFRNAVETFQTTLGRQV